MAEDQQIDNIKNLLSFVGEDPDREGLQKTPARFLRSMNYLTSGYKLDIKKIINESLFTEECDDMVIVRDIEFYSLCEHHLLPFYGKCHVGYIPNGKILGLSKIPRVVNAFSRRLQVQERLTHQVSTALQEHLAPQGVGVVMEAVHMCMMIRGVEKQNPSTLTSSMKGCFRTSRTREEFMAHLTRR